jgi:hypothetical protein
VTPASRPTDSHPALTRLRLIEPEALARHLDYQPADAGTVKRISDF